MPLWMDVAQLQGKQQLSISCPLLCSCFCHHLPPPARPSPHLLHFSCNHVAMQMLCTERLVLPSPGHHSQLPEPLSWPPRGGRRGSHYCYHSQARSLHCQTAPPTHKVLDDFTKTSNFSRTPFIMTNRNQSLQTTAHSSRIRLLIWLPKMAQGEKKKRNLFFPPQRWYPIHISGIFIIHHLRFLTSATDCADGLAGISHSWERR